MQRVGRIWLLIALLVLVPAPVAAERLTAGGDHDFAPYEFLDADGQPAGLNVDLIRAVGEVGGFDVDFTLGPWTESRAAIASGQIDILSMYVADFRVAEIDYATPHVIIYHEIFIRQNLEPIGSLDELTGKEVIVQRDAWVQEQLQDLGLTAELIEVQTEREALRLLASGRHDAALVSEIVGRRILSEEKLDNLTTSGAPLFPVGYALAVTQGNTELLERIESGLAELKSSGQFNAIYERWLGPIQDRTRVGPITRWLLIATPALIAGFLLAMIWRQSRQPGDDDSQGDIEARYRHDSLTGLPNRVELEEAVADYLTTPDKCGALLHIDVDQFKLINDSRDYQAGDDLIRQLADFFRAQVEPGDFLARPGSDEFCLLLSGDQSPFDRAESLRLALEQHEFLSGKDRVQLTASIGIATLDQKTSSIGELLKQAEAACHAAKESGRNRVHLYHAEDEVVAERHGQLRWVREVNLALKDNRLSLHYQTIEPACPGPDDSLLIEILLRLSLPDGSLVSAGEFVPAAEKYFVAHRIDRWVVRAALGWLEKHRAEVPQLERVFINLSARSLGDDRFLPFILEQIETHDVPPGMLGFELTETAVMTHLKTGLKTIERLRALGCHFALDDFGVGISSMAYLKNLPVDMLKIDGSFARGALNNGRERTMLSEINDLGHVLGKTTVIEHVECDRARSLMADLDIDLVQGYGISRPRPLDDLLN